MGTYFANHVKAYTVTLSLLCANILPKDPARFSWAQGIKPAQASLVFEMYDTDISA